MFRRALRLIAAAIPLCSLLPSAGGNPSVSIAAAANLICTLDALNAAFTRTAPDVVLTAATGASGSLFAQIAHGAPFDVFLSADTEYPRRLVAQQLGDAATLRRFATGRLVVWTTRTDLELGDLVTLVRAPSVRKIAIAQPKAAPYGRAAQAALAQLGVWYAVEPKIVFGESIAQTAQFVETGNADIGFVALSLVRSSRLGQQGRWLEVPPALYAGVPLEHAVVLTTRGAANAAARRYLEFLSSDTAKKILRDFGYLVP